jgi:hypothetical protein
MMDYNKILKEGYRVPGVIHISGRDAGKLYQLEDERNNAIKEVGRELQKYLKQNHEDDFSDLWKHVMPQAIYDIFDSFDQKAVFLACIAFMENIGFKIVGKS